MTPEAITRTGSKGTPIIAVHSWRGEPENYARLSAKLGDQLIYSLHHPDPDAGDLPRRVDAWVDHHRRLLELTGLEPPYRLAGYSFGGVVVVELARRLLAEGHAVDYVGLIDSTRPRLVPLTTREFIWYHLDAAAAMEDSERLPYLAAKARLLAARTFPRTARLSHRALQAVGLRPPDAPNTTAKPSDPLTVSIHVSYLNYRGDPVPFPVHLYTTAGSTEHAQAPAHRWLPWLHGGYTLTPIAGEHLTIFTDEHVESLAAAMRPHIRAADSSITDR